jgi:hypothetical protein
MENNRSVVKSGRQSLRVANIQIAKVRFGAYAGEVTNASGREVVDNANGISRSYEPFR